MRRIFIFGDSIAFGRGVKNNENWASEIHDFFDTNYNEENIVFNLAIPSETSTELNARFEKEMKIRIKSKTVEDYNLVIIAIGINDCKLKLKESQVTKDHFLKNIDEIIDIAEKYADKIVFIGLTKVKGKEIGQFKNTLIREYNDLLEVACLSKKIMFIDIFKKWPACSDNYYCEDGVHLNKTGHKYIAERIINEFSSLNKEFINPFPVLKNELSLDKSGFETFGLKNLDLIKNDLFLGQLQQEFSIPDVVLGGPCIRRDINSGGISLNTFYQIFLPIKVASLFRIECKVYLGLQEELILSPKKTEEYLLLADQVIKAIYRIALDYKVDVAIINTSDPKINHSIQKSIQENKLSLSKEESENLYSFSSNQNKVKEHTVERVLVNQRVITCHGSLFLKKVTGHNSFLIVEDLEQIKGYLYLEKSDSKKKETTANFLAVLPLPSIFLTSTMLKGPLEEKIYLSLSPQEYRYIWKKSCPVSKRTYSALLELMGYKINRFSSNCENFVSGMEKISGFFNAS
jgi:lysophospholipase L1-like esterase